MHDAKRAISEGRSPAIEKQREKRRLLEAKSFGEFGEKWLTAAPMADNTRAMRRSIFERELLPVWRNRLLTEITPDDLRAHCGAIDAALRTLPYCKRRARNDRPRVLGTSLSNRLLKPSSLSSVEPVLRRS